MNGKILAMNPTVPFKATFDNVVLEKVVYQASKLYLSEEAAASVRKKWRVVNVGPDVKCVKVEDFIIFNSPTAGEIDNGDGKKYVILPEKDIVAVYR